MLCVCYCVCASKCVLCVCVHVLSFAACIFVSVHGQKVSVQIKGEVVGHARKRLPATRLLHDEEGRRDEGKE